jgi:phosphoglycolate phosphatase-like HAD superfamily hydrolase
VSDEPDGRAANDGPGYAVIDIDGVVSDARHRLRFLDRRPKDWDAFFAAAPNDPVLPEGRAVVEELATRGHEIVWLTGRPERCRQDTLDWLDRSALPPGRLHMRRDGDRRPARQTKLEVLRRLELARPVTVMVDDDDLVVRTLRAAGFTVLHATWMTAQPTLFDAQENEGRT